MRPGKSLRCSLATNSHATKTRQLATTMTMGSRLRFVRVLPANWFRCAAVNQALSGRVAKAANQLRDRALPEALATDASFGAERAASPLDADVRRERL